MDEEADSMAAVEAWRKKLHAAGFIIDNEPWGHIIYSVSAVPNETPARIERAREMFPNAKRFIQP